ncbi:MAG TPA: hypothetical protein VJV04_02035 [Nitrospiraceae bacterium]|nr:hypothetical protein [Nitrospiraceae bacterium]
MGVKHSGNYSRNEHGITRTDVLEVKDGGRELNYPGSAMAYPPEGSDQEARLSMNPSAEEVNNDDANQRPGMIQCHSASGQLIA